MKRMVIVKAGDKIPALGGFPGDYEDWIAAGMGGTRAAVEVVVACRGEPLPHLDEVVAIAITGSPAMVTERAAWMLTAEAWLREAVVRDIPILGVCFGHQLLAQALGGRVAYNPKGIEVGTVALTLTAQASADPLFAGLPRVFEAQTTHRQTVEALPHGAIALAASDLDRYQAFRCGSRAWGVQFHPEFDARMMPHFIDQFRASLAQEGKDADTLTAAIRPTPEAALLLRRFARLIAEA